MDSGVASLIGVVVGASITSLREWIVLWKTRRRGAVYLVSRIAPLLDEFVAKCASVSRDEGEDDHEGRTFTTVDTPTLDFKDLDADWKTLPAGLMRELLEIPFKIDVADKAIADTDEHSDPYDNGATFEVRRVEYGQLGLATHALMIRLLQHAKLPQRPVRKWDPVRFIQEELVEIEVKREAREKAHQEWLKTAPPFPAYLAPDAVPKSGSS